MLAIGLAAFVAADAANAASEPAKKVRLPVHTGLGECVDFIIYGSATLTGQVNSTTYSLSYAAASWTDHAASAVYIADYRCSPDDLHGLYTTVGLLSHEMGHVHFDGPFSASGPRSAFIDRMCTAEGRAVLNNWSARSEVLQTSLGSVYIPLIANNATQLQALISGGGQGLDERVGSSFCDSNFTSTTENSYRDYYGQWYDKNIGRQSMLDTQD